MPWSLCSHTWNTPACSERMHFTNNSSRTDQLIDFVQMNSTFIFDETQKNSSIVDSKRSSADEYYHIYMLGINHSEGLTELGSIKTDLLLCLISIFIVMYLCIHRGVKSTGKVIKIKQ